jgi:hypothetical protein
VTYPQQPPYPPQPGYPPQTQPYAPAPQQPAYYQPQPGYPPQYPPQQYAQQGPPPPQQVLARGTLEDFLDQPSGGGGAATSKFFTPQRPQGSWLHLRVARDINSTDVRQQTDKFNTPLTFKSTGKPKFQTLVPCQLLDSTDPATCQQVFPDGNVTVYLKGIPFDAFKAAMVAAGVKDPVKAFASGQLGGAEFYMISAGQKQYGNGNPTNLFDFQYTPNGRENNAVAVDPTAAVPEAAAPAQVPAQAPQYASAPPPSPMTAPATTPPPAPPAPAASPYPAPSAPPTMQPAYDPNAAYYQATGQYPPQAPPAPPAPPQGYAPQQPGAGPVPPPVPGYGQQPPAPPVQQGQPAMTPEKQQLLQRLQGQQQ